MFDSLSGKLQNAFRNLRGLGKISEANVTDALRDVRMALLEADVNFKVARDFVERVKAKSIGVEVIQSIQPGQQIVKIIHDELVDLLGSENAALELSGNPSCVMMVGLHGSGKTTSSGKLARLLHRQGRTPLLVAADVYRPAAMDQLEKLGQQIDIPVFVRRGEKDVLRIARDQVEGGELGDRPLLEALAELPVAPVFGHLGVHHILIDGGQLVPLPVEDQRVRIVATRCAQTQSGCDRAPGRADRGDDGGRAAGGCTDAGAEAGDRAAQDHIFQSGRGQGSRAAHRAP